MLLKQTEEKIMEYKITENARNFMVNYFSKTPSLPVSLEQVTQLLAQITPIVETKAPQKPAELEPKK